MEKEKILIVDDEPDILDVLKITLKEEKYQVIEAKDGVEAIEMVKKKGPHLIILDFKMPRMNGEEVCKILKNDILLRHLPIIMLTSKREVSDKVKGIDAGADDYIVKPFEPTELLARVKMILRRTTLDLDANPLTRLPGNVSILSAIENCVEEKKPFAIAYLDLDKFKIFNDKYGFERGDEVIRETARLIIRNIKELGNTDDFIGHIGGDDFVFITTWDKCDRICLKMIKDFDALAPSFYTEEDREIGFIMGKDRQGHNYKAPILSISIGVVTNEHSKITHVAQVAQIGADLKSYAKSMQQGSHYVKDKRN